MRGESVTVVEEITKALDRVNREIDAGQTLLFYMLGVVLVVQGLTLLAVFWSAAKLAEMVSR
jgi:hypothetical protein